MTDRAHNGDTAANLGVEATRWQTADAPCTTTDAAEDQHIILGLSASPEPERGYGEGRLRRLQRTPGGVFPL